MICVSDGEQAKNGITFIISMSDKKTKKQKTCCLETNKQKMIKLLK